MGVQVRFVGLTVDVGDEKSKKTKRVTGLHCTSTQSIVISVFKRIISKD